MHKGAIAIFAFTIYLFSCAAPVAVTIQPPSVPPVAAVPPHSPPPVLLPNLTISDISLSETGK
ncbi:MAG TPA: hypothetical protein VLZ03_02725, partial [Thermodesulfobacteriota bacterium]|nr:hypothetical protein [Thermodesulfobacteriota bacterium]